MIRSNARPSIAVASLVIAMILASCGQSDDGGQADESAEAAVEGTAVTATAGAESARSTIVGHADALAAVEHDPGGVSLELVRLWTAAGASRELAHCYAALLQADGLSDGIEDLDDLSAAQAAFTQEQADAFGACGTTG